MLSKILTLHISNSYLNFLFVEKKWGQITDVNCWQKELSGIKSKSELAKSIKLELEEKKLIYDCLLLSILPENYFLRKLTFPFSDKNKISEILPQELEDSLPFPLDEFYYDFIPTTKDAAQNQQILCLGIKKQEIDELVQSLEDVNIYPFLIDLPYSSLLSLCSNIAEPRPKRYMLLHFEPECAFLLCIENNKLIEGHEFKWKLHKNSSPSDISNTNYSSNHDHLIDKIKISLLKADNDSIDFVIEQIIISGPYPENLPESIEKKLGIPVQEIYKLKFYSKLFQIISKKDIPKFCPNLGLFLGFGQKAKTLNFIQNKSRYKHYYKYKDNIKTIIISLFILLASISFSYISHIYVKKKRLNQIYNKMNEVISRNFKDIQGQLTPIQYISLFKSKIQQLNTNDKSLFTSKVKMIEILNLISSQIPKTLTVQFKNFTADHQHIRIQGITDSFFTVDKIKKSLESIDLFQKVEIKGAKTDPNGQVAFALHIDLSCDTKDS